MDRNDIQLQFFHHIKSSLPPHISFVDEIADLLDISNDSAYRRIRGEKMLSFEEIKKLCARFKISIDQLLNLNTDTTIFTGQFGQPESFKFEDHLQGFLQNVQYLHSFERKEMFYFTKDTPGFSYFAFPELAAFKYFAWMKTLLNYPQFASAKFRIDEMKGAMQDTGQKIVELYAEIPSTEIMNVDNVMTTLRQIEYYKESGLFADPKDPDRLFDKMDELVNHQQAQAESGVKFLPGKKAHGRSAELKMFVNDFVVGDNSILATLNDTKICFLNHNIVNFIATGDRKFTEYSYQFIQNIIRKSMLISVVGERERTKFFNLIRERIDIFRNNQFKTLLKM